MQYDHTSTFAIAAKGAATSLTENGKMSAIVSHTTMATYDRSVFMVRVDVDREESMD